MENCSKNSLSFLLCVENENGKHLGDYPYIITENYPLYVMHNDLSFKMQMLPLIQRSADNLVVAVGEKAASEESFEVLK